MGYILCSRSRYTRHLCRGATIPHLHQRDERLSSSHRTGSSCRQLLRHKQPHKSSRDIVEKTSPPTPHSASWSAPCHACIPSCAGMRGKRQMHSPGSIMHGTRCTENNSSWRPATLRWLPRSTRLPGLTLIYYRTNDRDGFGLSHHIPEPSVLPRRNYRGQNVASPFGEMPSL